MPGADVLGTYLGPLPREDALVILGKHRGEEVATWLELADGRAVMAASGVLDPSAGPEALYEVTDDGIVSLGLPTDCEVDQYEQGMRVAAATVSLIVRWQSDPTRPSEGAP